MKYKGCIKKSRTYDSIALAGMLDVTAAAFILYTPEQLGIAVPAYLGIRILLGCLQVYFRRDTTGPVGEK